jgi:hypothetical protein
MDALSNCIGETERNESLEIRSLTVDNVEKQKVLNWGAPLSETAECITLLPP